MKLFSILTLVFTLSSPLVAFGDVVTPIVLVDQTQGAEAVDMMSVTMRRSLFECPFGTKVSARTRSGRTVNLGCMNDTSRRQMLEGRQVDITACRQVRESYRERVDCPPGGGTLERQSVRGQLIGYSCEQTVGVGQAPRNISAGRIGRRTAVEEADAADGLRLHVTVDSEESFLCPNTDRF